MRPLRDARVFGPAETALALNLVSELDLLRLKALARWHARGLPPEVSWEDLLQEALTRMLTGARRQPEGINTVAFLAGIMRSLRAEHWRRVLARSGEVDGFRIDHAVGEPRDIELRDPAPSPERALSARQEVNAITRLFAGDELALRIIAGLSEGLSAEQIRTAYGISRTDYDSARKRMRRTLLREGLTCESR
jgi:DNA-directed RNA polymerase specialized sigma24 family protein